VGATAELDVAAFDGMFAANVRAPFYLVAAFAPGMAARGRAASSTSAVWRAVSAYRRCGLRGHQGRPGLLDARMDR